MTNFLQKFALSTATVATAIVVMDVSPAAAIDFNFSGGVDSGNLTGFTYDGSFSVDNITPDGSSVINSLNINFSAGGISLGSFDETDANTTVLADFDANGNIAGFSFGATDVTLGIGNPLVNFQFSTGFDPGEVIFSYDFVDIPGGGGFGDVTLQQVPTEQVPEPFTILGSLTALGVGTVMKKQACKKG